MKKHLVVNILVSLAFIISGPLLDKCSDWADSFSLGAEMVLGMSLPVILAFFVLFAVVQAKEDGHNDEHQAYADKQRPLCIPKQKAPTRRNE